MSHLDLSNWKGEEIRLQRCHSLVYWGSQPIGRNGRGGTHLEKIRFRLLYISCVLLATCKRTQEHFQGGLYFWLGKVAPKWVIRSHLKAKEKMPRRMWRGQCSIIAFCWGHNWGNLARTASSSLPSDKMEGLSFRHYWRFNGQPPVGKYAGLSTSENKIPGITSGYSGRDNCILWHELLILRVCALC